MLGWEILGIAFGLYFGIVIAKEGVIRYGAVFSRNRKT